MKVIPLPSETRVNTGFTHKVIIGFADLISAAGLTKTLNIFPDQTNLQGICPAGFTVLRAGVHLITPFAVGVSLAVDVGDKALATRYIQNANTDLMTPLATNTKSDVLGSVGYAFTTKDFADGNTVVTALFTATVNNLATLTVGQMEIYLTLFDNSRLPQVMQPGS